MRLLQITGIFDPHRGEEFRIVMISVFVTIAMVVLVLTGWAIIRAAKKPRK